MIPSAPSPGGVAGALALAARAQPETPFLFYRDARSQFRWFSFSAAVELVDLVQQGGLSDEKLSVKGVVVERAAAELAVGFLRTVLLADAASANAIESRVPGPGSGRDIWISWRSLSDPGELALARWAVARGAAILLEPGPSLHPELFAWARPTVASGGVEELSKLAGELELLAPRLLRRRWLRLRVERLRLVLVSGPLGAADLARLEGRWRELSPAFSARVEPLVAGSLV